MLAFVIAESRTPERIKRHISCHAISELILKIINLEDLPESSGILAWLKDFGLIEHLIDELDPKKEPETHCIAAQTLIDIITLTYQNQALLDPSSPTPDVTKIPTLSSNSLLIAEMKSKKCLKKLLGYMLNREDPHASSSLINGINIIMEIIRKYCRFVSFLMIAK
jgi:hypothetical protein